MTILERLKDAEVEIKALLQDLKEERKKNATLQQQLTNVQKVSNSEYWSLRDEIHKLREKRTEQTAQNEALRRDLIVSRTETKNLQELYEEQVRYTASMCKRLQSGKNHWLVVGGKNIDAESVIHDGPLDAMQFAQIYGGEVVHVREVVNVDYYTEPKAEVPVGVVMDAIRADQSSYGIRSVTQWPVYPEPLWTPFTDLADGWFHIDAIQIIDYDWRYAGWTDGTRRYGPICCTGPLTTFDTVSLLDEWGNDLLTCEGMQKHCNAIEKQLDDALKLLRETCGEHYGLFDWYGFRLRAKALVEKYGEGGDE